MLKKIEKKNLCLANGDNLYGSTFKRLSKPSLKSYDFDSQYIVPPKSINKNYKPKPLEINVIPDADVFISKKQQVKYTSKAHLFRSINLDKAFMGFNHDWDNYFHWILQGLYNFYIYEKYCSDSHKYLVPEWSDMQIETLEIIGVDNSKFVVMDKLDHYHVKELFHTTALSGSQVFTPDGDFLREYLLFLKSRVIKQPFPNGGKKIYISRLDAHRRKVLNEKNIISHLEKEGFIICTPGELSVTQQINLFSEAALIVAPHGAGCTNVGFASPGTVFIECFSNNYINQCFFRIAQIMGLNYIAIDFLPVDEGKHHHLTSWEINIETLMSTIGKCYQDGLVL